MSYREKGYLLPCTWETSNREYNHARSTYWDSLKGIAIIAVIIIHSCGKTSEFPVDSFNWSYGLALRQFVNFAVPLFLALAGFFSSPKPGESIPLFYLKRFKRIIPPYLIWSLVAIILNYPSHLFLPNKLLSDLLLGKGIGIGYFVIVLIQYTLLTPLIWKIKKKWHNIAIMATLFTISMLMNYIVRLNYPESIFAEFPFHMISFLSWYPFYHLGVYLSGKNIITSSLIVNVPKCLLISLFPCLIISLIEGFYFGHLDLYEFGASQIKASSFATSIMLFLLAISFSTRKVFFDIPFIVWLGRCSYIIYLTHSQFIARIGSKLGKISFIYECQPVYVFISLVLTLLACYLMVLIFSFLFPDKFLKNYLGACPIKQSKNE